LLIKTAAAVVILQLFAKLKSCYLHVCLPVLSIWIVALLKTGGVLRLVQVSEHCKLCQSCCEFLIAWIRMQNREIPISLSPFQVNGDIPPRLKKSAHEIILDFIRSRPPLNPVCNPVGFIPNKNVAF